MTNDEEMYQACNNPSTFEWRCIFCTSPCPDLIPSSIPHQKPIAGSQRKPQAAKNTNLTSQSELALDFNFSENNNPLLCEHLKVFFILKNILKIPDEKLSQFLSQGHPPPPPEFWLNVCLSCHSQVIQFYEGLKEINRLQRKLVKIEAELKGKIYSSQIDGKDEDSKSIWTQIRTQVLNDFGETYVSEVEISGGNLDNSVQEELIQVPVHLAHCDQQSESCGNDSYFNLPLTVKHEFGDEDEESRVTEEWNAEANAIKDEHDSSNSSLSSFASEPSHLEWSSDSNSEVDDDDDSDEDSELSQKGPTKKSSTLKTSLSKTVQNQKPAKRNHKKNIIRQWDMSNPTYILFSRGKQTFYGCRKCPADYSLLEELENHLKAHEENSGGVACSETGCGWYILPKNVDSHYKTRHGPPEAEETLEEEEKERIHNKKEKLLTTCSQSSSSSSSSSSFFDSNDDENEENFDDEKDADEEELPERKLRGPTCPHCTFPAFKKIRLKNHLKVHKKGANSLPCPECGWYVFEEKLRHHLGFVHKIGTTVGRQREKKRYHYKCTECGALLCRMRDYRDHELLHKAVGAEGHVCPKCGWLCRRMSSHNKRWHSEKKEGERPHRPREVRLVNKGATVSRKAKIS